MIKEDEQQARQAQQEGVEQQRDDVKGADGKPSVAQVDSATSICAP